MVSPLLPLVLKPPGQRLKPRRAHLALLLCTTAMAPRNVTKSYVEVVRPVALLPPVPWHSGCGWRDETMGWYMG